MAGEFRPGPESTPAWYSTWYAGLGDPIYVSVDDGVNGQELWRSDGTPAGTALVIDLQPGSQSSFPTALAALGGELLFFGQDPIGRALWATDGTAAGTREVLRTPSFAGGLAPAIASTLTFWVTDATGADVLWATDGTTVGTQSIATFDPNGTSPTPSPMARPGATRLLFAGDDVLGIELWGTDGTAAGTQPVADIGIVDSDPQGFIRLGRQVLFTADDGLLGAELWSVDLSTLGDYAAEVYGLGCAGTGGVEPEIGLVGEPRVSAAAPYDIVATAARPSAAAALLVGVDRARLPLGGGCGLRLAPPLVALPTATDGSGRAAITLPQSAALIGQQIVFPYGIADPARAFAGIALTPGLEVVGG
ncbi:MAG: ELWxxDGT repeat protein [Planctomycetota bacterium]